MISSSSSSLTEIGTLTFSLSSSLTFSCASGSWTWTDLKTSLRNFLIFSSFQTFDSSWSVIEIAKNWNCSKSSMTVSAENAS